MDNSKRAAPGGARPHPKMRPAASDTARVSIPAGNVPGMHIDQGGQGGWHQPPQSLPSLALNPVRSSPSPSLGRPKLSLAPPSASANSTRTAPSLRLAIPRIAPAGSAAVPSMSAHDYPTDMPDDDTLRTPTPRHPPSGLHQDLSALSLGSEDANPTLQARGRDDDDGESSYGYGQLGNGLVGPTGDAISAMTEDIRQAVSRNRFDPAGERGSRSRAGSVRSERSSDSRRNSGTLAKERLDSAPLYALSRPGSANASPSPSGGSQRSSLEFSRELEEEEGQDEEKRSPTFDPNELIFIQRLGEGTGGSVDLVKDKSGKIMARKVIARTANPSIHKQLLRELEILNSCSSPYIVEHYGSFLADHDSTIGILMEFCEAGSLDSLLQHMKKNSMRCSEHVLGRVASSVLKGLDYLHQRRIIHRDIKPSNIVITRQGAVKLCDFGVSGELVESLAGTFTGTSFYMAPERIQNKPYSIKADVWSLGMSLHEVAHLRFPFPAEGENQYVAPIELLSYIVTAPVPVMVDDASVGRVWSDGIKDFMGQCLIRSGTERPYPWQLLRHPFIIANEAKKVNMAKWVAALCGWPFP